MGWPHGIQKRGHMTVFCSLDTEVMHPLRLGPEWASQEGGAPRPTEGLLPPAGMGRALAQGLHGGSDLK